MSLDQSITIIGGGVSGITTGIVLQLLGYETTCYTHRIVSEETENDPRFASLYPAASVIPHSTDSGQIEELFPVSLSVFELLYRENLPGVELHTHYEVFEFEKDLPAYTRFLNNLEEIDPETDPLLPRRSPGQSLWGWSFDCFMAEWPIYMARLYDLYRQAGGHLILKKVRKEEIPDLESEAVVNCTGIRSYELFEDDTDPLVIRGDLIHIPNAPLVQDDAGRIVSYNYTPASEIYSDNERNPADVYFYPRMDGWIIGGSRLKGTLDENGRWNGEMPEPLTEITGVELPRPIVNLNCEIIKESYDLSPTDYKRWKAQTGYRFMRNDKKGGLRLETTEEYGKTVIHNYGHGGAGVTLSWGCGLEVARQIKEQGLTGDPASFGEPVLDSLQTFLADHV